MEPTSQTQCKHDLKSRCLVCDQRLLTSADGKSVHPTSQHSSKLYTVDTRFSPCLPHNSVSSQGNHLYMRSVGPETPLDDKTVALSLLEKLPCILQVVCKNGHPVEIEYGPANVFTRYGIKKSEELRPFYDELGIVENSNSEAMVEALENVDFFIHTPMVDVVINMIQGEQPSTLESSTALGVRCTRTAFEEQMVRSYKHDTMWFFATPHEVIDGYKRSLDEKIRLSFRISRNVYCGVCESSD